MGVKQQLVFQGFHYFRLFRYQASTSIASWNTRYLARVFLNHAEKLKNYCFKIFFYILSFIRFYIEIIDVYQILGVFSELNTYSDSFPKPIIHHSSTHAKYFMKFFVGICFSSNSQTLPGKFFLMQTFRFGNFLSPPFRSSFLVFELFLAIDKVIEIQINDTMMAGLFQYKNVKLKSNMRTHALQIYIYQSLDAHERAASLPGLR